MLFGLHVDFLVEDVDLFLELIFDLQIISQLVLAGELAKNIINDRLHLVVRETLREFIHHDIQIFPLVLYLLGIFVKVGVLLKQPTQLLGAFLQLLGGILDFELYPFMLVAVGDPLEVAPLLDQSCVLLFESGLLFEQLSDLETG